MLKFSYLKSLKFSLNTLAAILLAGCIHIPAQPQVSHSSPEVKQQPARCVPAVSLLEKGHISRHGLSPERISVLNWNMFKQSRENWSTDFDQLSQNQDLLILQEAYMNEELASVLSASPFSWTMTTTFFYRDKANGVLTASRNKSSGHCALYTKEPLIQTPKSILLSTYPIIGSEQKLLVVNVHGINFSLGLESYRQQFSDLHQVMNNHSGPLILAGDFNSWREDRQAVLDILANELSLQRVGYEGHQRITVFGNPIDHIYYRGLKVVEASSPSVTSSDHNPLLVTFRITEPLHNQYAQTP